MKRMCVIVMTLSVLVSGCQNQRAAQYGGYPVAAADPRRDTASASKLNVEAVELLKNGQLDEAEKKLRAALSEDLFFGPAHNNLGTLYHRQERYYEAAWEFQYAVKLMPNRAQPKSNLGLVYEAVGRLDESAKWYEEALSLEPDNVEIMGNLARVMVQTDRRSKRTKHLLSELVMKDHRPQWIAWAKEQLALIGQPETPAASPEAPKDQPEH